MLPAPEGTAAQAGDCIPPPVVSQTGCDAVFSVGSMLGVSAQIRHFKSFFYRLVDRNEFVNRTSKIRLIRDVGFPYGSGNPLPPLVLNLFHEGTALISRTPPSLHKCTLLPSPRHAALATAAHIAPRRPPSVSLFVFVGLATSNLGATLVKETDDIVPLQGGTAKVRDRELV